VDALFYHIAPSLRTINHLGISMSLKKYLAEVSEHGAVSEIALYTPLATHVLCGPLNYSAKHYEINKSGAKGRPDIRIFSGDDDSEWIVCEVKLHDEEIRKAASRKRIWQEQIIAQGYLRAETFYVLLCAPRTFYVCDLKGAILEGVHLEGDEIVDAISGERFTGTDANFRKALSRVTFEASCERPQYEQFRQGRFPSGHIPLSSETIPHLREVFEFALRELKKYCAREFSNLQEEYKETQAKLKKLEQRLETAGSDTKSRRQLSAQIRRLKKQHRLVLQLFEVDYPQFRHDQTYAGTEKEEHFEDIFITNTAYVALSRLFFVRICEDAGLTTRKLSHEGPSLWRRFVENLKSRYQDLLEVAFKDVAHVYFKLFEESIFDWYGHGNGQLHGILEGILFRLNAFSFKEVSRDVLGSIYQYFRPKAERKRLGEYYTAEEAVDYILAQTGISSDPELMTKRILDPSCGSFTFGVRALVPLLKAGAQLSAKNKLELAQRCLAGYDINPFSVFLSHLSLLFAMLEVYLAAKREDASYSIAGFAVHNRNSLASVEETTDVLHGEFEQDEKSADEPADYVVGNPPFVRNERLPAGDREALDELFAAIKERNTDLSTYFLYCAITGWLKEGGTLGMVAPIGTANTKMAEKLRAVLRDYSVFQVVSLEWMAKEIFPDADIIPMLLFVKKARPPKDHKITVVAGLRRKSDLKQAVVDKRFFAKHASQLDYQKWLNLSPTGDWPLEVKAVDVPILEKLRKCPELGTIVKASFAVKHGSEAKIIRPYHEAQKHATEIPFLKGQHVCAYALSEADEMIDLAKIKKASDASLWKDLKFYRENEGRVDESGLGRRDYSGHDLFNDHMPSDVLCCLVPEIYVTLIAAVANPLDVCANNSVIAVTPFKYSAHVIAAIINSRLSRYYAFLLLRSGVLLRRRAHWYPRTIENTPLPELKNNQAARLHRLANEAAVLSQGMHLNELDLFEDLMSQCKNLSKAGFLGLRWPEEEAQIDRDELAESKVKEGRLEIEAVTLTGENAALELLRTALLALGQDDIPLQSIQDILLPSEAPERARIAKEIAGLATKLEKSQQRMSAIGEEIDEIMADGLGLSSREHEVIRKRCQQFPLSDTVERPRFAWSTDRKRQARREYELGKRFK
jgi:hypothetical protein